MKLNIFIIRHGEKNKDGSKLSARGREQARFLASRLKKEDINKIYSSDLQRCKETAEIISKSLNLPINYIGSLREVPAKVKEFPQKHKNEIRIIKSFWNKLNKESGNILLVSSGIVNRILTSFALDIPQPKANFMQYPTGLTKIEKSDINTFREWYKQFNPKAKDIEKVGKKRFKIWFVNDTSHLPEKLRITQKY